MARAYGSRAQLALAFESTYGTPPASGYLALPFASTTLDDAQPRSDSELLGFGRDPQDSVLEGLTVGGEVVVPLDSVALGHWLKLIFGAPTTTGSGPYTHTYVSGAASIPSASIEIGTPEVPQFRMFAGVRADGFRLQMQRTGLMQVRIPLMGQSVDPSTTTQAGTPTATSGARFSGFQGSIAKDGSALGSIQSAELSFSNGLEAVDTIRADGLIEGVDPTMCSFNASLQARFTSTALYDDAVAGTAMELAFAHTISAGVSLTITAQRAHLERPATPINGPGGIQQAFTAKGAKDTSPARMLTVVLVNGVASYA